MKSYRSFISFSFILLVILGLAALGGAGWWASKYKAPQQAGNEITSTSQNITKPQLVPAQAVFTKIGGGFRSDGERIYYYEKLVPSADAASFASIPSGYDGSYGKDKNHVYYQDKVVAGADPATFILLDEGREFGKDAHHVYDARATYFGRDPLMKDADPQTFTILKGGFEKDTTHVYYGPDLFPADPFTFIVIADNQGAKNETVWAKDATHVFYEGGWGQREPSIIKNAEPATFAVLDEDSYSGGYAKDVRAVYWGDTEVKGADPETFVDMVPYGKDKNSVYLGATNFDNADPGANKINNVDPKTFTILFSVEFSGAGYTKDAQSVFFLDKKIPGADPTTFMQSGTNDPDTIMAKDKNHGYMGAKIVY